LLGAMLATLCVAGMAVAETESDLAGRWVAGKRKLVLDVSRCGAGWCGVEVADGACGRTILRVAMTAAEGNRNRIRGRLELAADTESYAVQVSVYPPKADGPPELLVSGHTGGRFEMWRRTFPFSDAFARVGNAACPPDSKTS
jgi:hypothetical protein